MKVSVLGSGVVGEVLANGFLKYGYEVMRASRDPQKLNDWLKSAKGKPSTGDFKKAAQWGDVVVLAVKGSVAEDVIKSIGNENLKRKTIIDATNPIAEKPPVNGVLQFFTDINFSLMERLQQIAPDGNFVKAFSCVGNAFMINPDFSGTKPTMFISGNSDSAKGTVTEILTQFGWETEDMGKAEAARAIEPLCMLWCLPGFSKNQWSHAFKLLKK
jgi:predicted dinucleotide-binding enzyme